MSCKCNSVDVLTYFMPCHQYISHKRIGGPVDLSSERLTWHHMTFHQLHQFRTVENTMRRALIRHIWSYVEGWMLRRRWWHSLRLLSSTLQHMCDIKSGGRLMQQEVVLHGNRHEHSEVKARIIYAMIWSLFSWIIKCIFQFVRQHMVTFNPGQQHCSTLCREWIWVLYTKGVFFPIA